MGREKQELMKHCMICDLVLVEGVWIGQEEFRDLGLAAPTSGVYHIPCASIYVKQYMGAMDQDFQQHAYEDLVKRIKELYDEPK